MLVSPAQVAQYHEQGYCILENVIPAQQLEDLRNECGRFIDMMHAEMDEKGTDVLGISHRNRRYFVSRRYLESPLVTQFLFGDTMAEVTRALLGDTVYLFHEQYVVKAPEIGMKFSWHQDSGYVKAGGGPIHAPYLSCWCALDDVTLENGTVFVLPYDRAPTREIVDHEIEAGSNDKVGYFGDDPGEPAIVPAGSIVAFSSVTFHRSGPNTSDQMRRVYLAQYSAEHILRPDTGQPWGMDVPFLQDGVRMAG
ncbi:MAG: phytanoyl-CoA dioxygenase family protein [Caldilineaceae bacterium]|nr:phytanoyl-CoA dioxygenase family protein [Caldilineaceae bacterium]